jgi:HEPN domain-containing protein
MGLKAIISLKRGRSPRTHSIQLMTKLAEEDYPEMSSTLKSLKDLDPYYIAARYFEGFPDGIPLDYLTQSDAEKAAEIAKSFLAEISIYFN